MHTNEDKNITTQTAETNESVLLNFRPALFCAVFLCLGICLGRAFQSGTSFLWLLVVPVFACFVVLIGRKNGWRKVLVKCAILSICGLVGLGGYTLQTHNFSKGGYYEGEYFISGFVEERALQGNRCRILLDDIEIDGSEEKGKLIAYLPYTFYEEIALSQEIAMTANVRREKESFEENSFYAYFVYDDIRFSATADTCTVIGRRFNLFEGVRQRMQRVIDAGMDETCAAVTVGVLTGDDAMIESGLLDNFRYGGIAHIFAVSGLHVGALYAFCLWLVQKTRLRRSSKALRFTMVAALLLFYGGICGYSASVVRAIVMCLLLYAAKLIGIASDSGEAIGAAAIIVLLLSPIALFTVGFQLSFAACFGIAWLSRPISSLLIKKKVRNRDEDTAPPTLLEGAKESALSFLAVTFSAQLATAPIQMMNFGYVSGWALLLNCIFVPLISMAFSLLLALVFLSCLLPLSVSAILLYIPNLIWTVLLLAFEIFDFSSFALTGIALSGGGVIAYYLTCFLLTDKWNIRKSRKRILLLLSFSVFLVTTVAIL